MTEGTQGKKKNRGILYIILILLVLTLLGGGILLTIHFLKNQDSKPVDTSGQLFYTREQLDENVAEAVQAASDEARQKGNAEGRLMILDALKVGLSLGNSVVDTLRPLYPNELVLVSNGAYHFVSIDPTLKQNTYKSEYMTVTQEGVVSYQEDETLVSHKGIDVSKHQYRIDWKQVAEDGVEFAFIRVGNRGYGSAGKLLEDEYADANLQGAQSVGIKTGVYFYTQAITEEEMLEEAQFVIDKLSAYTIELPVVIDVEKVSPADGRMNALSAEERTRLVKLFCETVQAAGYKPMIYHNMETGIMMLNLSELEEYDKWFAYYKTELYYPYAYKVWQYTSKGSVKGIEGEVDLNISFGPLWEE